VALLTVPGEVAPANFFAHFMELTEKLLDSHLDIVAYEDTLREMFNVNAYKVFTLDKLVHGAVRQVCRCAISPLD
jgi:histone deacetylase complex regulatory component SIN3